MALIASGTGRHHGRAGAQGTLLGQHLPAGAGCPPRATKEMMQPLSTLPACRLFNPLCATKEMMAAACLPACRLFSPLCGTKEMAAAVCVGGALSEPCLNIAFASRSSQLRQCLGLAFPLPSRLKTVQPLSNPPALRLFGRAGQTLPPRAPTRLTQPLSNPPTPHLFGRADQTLPPCGPKEIDATAV